MNEWMNSNNLKTMKWIHQVLRIMQMDGLTRIYLYNQQTVTSRVRKEKQDWEQLKERKKKEVV